MAPAFAADPPDTESLQAQQRAALALLSPPPTRIIEIRLTRLTHTDRPAAGAISQ